MSRPNVFEIVLSAMVVLCAAGFLVFLRLQTGIGGLSSYEMNAELAKADGLAVGTDVKIAGAKVGRVTDLALEPRTYHVKLQMEIRSGIPIPTDSRLSVSGGTMSSTYLNINPGRSPQTVPPGGTLGAKS
jgi:phospholipid/cholesterol/gamma-HCH transport system substrate-binding protein